MFKLNLLLILAFTISQLALQFNVESRLYSGTNIIALHDDRHANIIDCYQLTWNETQISSNKVSIDAIHDFLKSELKFVKISNENVCEKVISFSGKLVFVAASKKIDPVIWFFSNSKPRIDKNTINDFDKFLIDGTTLYFEEIKINDRIPMKSLSIKIQNN